MTTPKWMEFALGEVGTRESPGIADSPRVVEYLEAVDLSTQLRHDATPWCSAFANWCMKQAGIPGTGSAAARSWLDWGKPLSTPKRGCIVVLWRKARDTPFGHVGFYMRASGNRVSLLGGNQGDMVSISPYSAARVLSYRWPA
jgi:uncharacterized protein (TIGR02594 family)